MCDFWEYFINFGKYLNFSSKKFSPYLIGGYGLSDFGKKLTFEGVFKSLGAGRTIHGGLGFDISISNKISLNIFIEFNTKARFNISITFRITRSKDF